MIQRGFALNICSACSAQLTAIYSIDHGGFGEVLVTMSGSLEAEASDEVKEVARGEASVGRSAEATISGIYGHAREFVLSPKGSGKLPSALMGEAWGGL